MVTDREMYYNISIIPVIISVIISVISVNTFHLSEMATESQGYLGLRPSLESLREGSGHESA